MRVLHAISIDCAVAITIPPSYKRLCPSEILCKVEWFRAYNRFLYNIKYTMILFYYIILKNNRFSKVSVKYSTLSKCPFCMIYIHLSVNTFFTYHN